MDGDSTSSLSPRMTSPTLYLASRSPRRQALLDQIGVTYTVITADIDETPRDNEASGDYVMRMAYEKAQAGLAAITPQNGAYVLAADTSVILDNQIIGKPIDDVDAAQWLKQLSGRTHQVMTAVCLMSERKVEQAISVNDVTFSFLTDTQIEQYIRTGEGRDKAGSYAVQGKAALFIEKIQGSYSGIMGLPLWETGQLLKQMEVLSEQ
jgi:septum formation protein